MKLAKRIRERDGHTCRRCGVAWAKGQRRFAVDHVYPRRSLSDQTVANDERNLVTICHSCHSAKTTGAEADWLKGDGIAFAQYRTAVLGAEAARMLSALVGPHIVIRC